MITRANYTLESIRSGVFIVRDIKFVQLFLDLNLSISVDKNTFVILVCNIYIILSKMRINNIVIVFKIRAHAFLCHQDIF